jgi:hypothetical protein
MKFNLLTDDGKDEIVFREVGLGNCYVSAYGALVRGRKPAQLDVGESCVKRFNLSGQQPTTYKIVRVE